nr:hypothetical protein [Candidatus Magnetobacterium casensis]
MLPFHVSDPVEVVTTPVPEPDLVTVSVYFCVPPPVNVAVTLLAADIVTVQVALVPEQSPLQPVKVEPESAAAVRVTEVSLAKPAEHVEPQLIPDGELVTVPEPVPDFVTVRVGRFIGQVAEVILKYHRVPG